MPRVAQLQLDGAWQDVAQRQFGVISRSQLLGLGLTRSQARQWVRTRRWRRIAHGVYATVTGILPERAWIWAALLSAGDGAVATGRTALWLAGVLTDPPRPIHIAVPAGRRARARPGVRTTRSSTMFGSDRTRGSPPAVPVEEATLQACDDTIDLEAVLTLIFRVTQGRFTTAKRLRRALEQRSRHRWRQLLTELLAEVDAGVASALELRYLKVVERAHGLPRGERNRPEAAGERASRSRYIDVRYRLWRVVAELDGREAHPDESRFRDMQRDNGLTVDGDSVLRYGWHDVAGHPCLAAAQVVSALRRNGWDGQPRACGPACPVR